ncbi:P-loop containing nucleoside triphosphate hydrolase protein [Rhodotorula diobovata]|uniref:RNA helicase n=1 Tax=Rhodotorula diobovata TaxID=5288 RepID=A0A5C5FPV6_9BASI|nr:P-loop containing nucleoside triphosphate hydrolase protein [Rhodotorula diobovata]
MGKSKPAPPPPAAPDPASDKPKPRRKVGLGIVKSGNSANSANKPTLAPGETPPPPPLFPIGYKTPISLLQERCQKSGWERPFVDPKQGTTPGTWTASVTLRRKHPKKPGEIETVYMRPPPPPSQIAVEKGNAMEAKHWAAVYALFRFANNLRLNMQLPPATRDYWSALEKEKAASTPNKQWLWSTTPFETAAAAPPPPSAAPATAAPNAKGGASTRPSRNGSPLVNLSGASTPASSRPATPAPLPKSWAEAPEVRMPSSLRDLVERTIRDALPDLESLDLDGAAPDAGADDHAAEADDGTPGSGAATPPARSPAELALEAEFTALGFRRGHVLRALAYVRSGSAAPPTRNDVLAHLHLLVPESDLPPAFRDARPADATIRNATARDAGELGRMWQAERVAREVGAPVEWVRGETERARAATARENVTDGELEGMVVDVLARRLMDVPPGADEDERDKLGEDVLRAAWGAGAGPSNLSQEEKDELRQRRDDEVLGLEGLFGSRFRRTKDGIEIAVPHKGDRLSLRVLFHPGSSYPSPHTPPAPVALPSFFISSPTLPPYIRLHLHTLLASQFRPSVAQDGSAWLDLAEAGYGGVVGEMVSFLEARVRSAIEHPPDAREVMDRLVSPSERPTAPLAAGDAAKKVTRTQHAQRRGPPKGLRASPEQQMALKRAYEELCRTEGYQRMLEGRKRLPAWSMRDKIVDLIRNERVVIVCGETGSGKTTQVPAFVLEDAIMRGEGATTSIVVTQPRRVSAIGVASRVAAERCEDLSPSSTPLPSNLVGYAIRGERRAGPGTRALFCTTGVVLARLGRGGDPDLQGVSHIFIDEVHERSVDSDFLLLELRDILRRNPSIKVVLMSATINQKQFSDYFGGAPVVEIPGFTHPVRDFYLEEYLPSLLSSNAYRPFGKPARKATQAQLDRMRSSFIDQGVGADDVRALQALELATRADKIDFGLVGATVAHCLEMSRDVGGDVLVFMTGVLEITRSIEAIRAAVPSSQLSSLLVLPLHANLTSQEQTAVFRPTPRGMRKIVVATNVAETSITIDGIIFVVDCGRAKVNAFDPETGITKLQEEWTSRAGCRQRRGRAGRTRPGQCFKLFTHYTEDNVMQAQPTPEIQRTPLEALLLQIKSTRPAADVRDYLGKALDPPDVRAIESAWATLKMLGAVHSDGGEGAKGEGLSARLTPLGMHLAMIPVDVRLAKVRLSVPPRLSRRRYPCSAAQMLVLAAVFRCLDPILTIVAILSSKPFFLNPFEQRDEAKKARASFYTGKSDLLSDAKAFEACMATRKDGNAALRNFTQDNFISPSTFRDVLSLRTDYLSALSSVGFVPLRVRPDDAAFNVNSQNENLLKAIVFAGTARLVRVKLPKAVFDKGISGAIERERESREVKFFEPEGRVFLHPSSLLFEETKFASPFITFFNKQVTTKPFLRDANEVPLYALLLFSSGRISMELDRGVTVHLGARQEQWVHLRAWPRIGVLVNGLRKLFDGELEAELEEPGFGGPVSPAVQTMLELISRDGGLR